MATPTKLDEQQIWEALDAVPDPEMPFVSLIELGIVRQVDVQGGAVSVTITPTFSGCPAYEVMGEQIEAAVKELGADAVAVQITHDPPWTSEWITPAARAKLLENGLAPPPYHRGNVEAILLMPATCPRCGSMDTKLQSSFGTTPCRMIFTCNHCLEPFEQFKPL